MMTDNQVWEIIIATIKAGLLARGLTPDVMQSYQTTQQGATVHDVVLLHSIDSKRYGFPEDTSYWDDISLQMVQQQSYWLERTYQVDCLLGNANIDPNSKTALDYVEAVSTILQTSPTVESLRAAGVGILRIQPLRVGYFVDDKGRHEQVPSFDFTLTYQQVLQSTAIPLDTVDAATYGV